MNIHTARKFVAVLFIIIFTVGAFVYFYPRTTGKEILKYIQQENIQTVMLEKTIEDGDGICSVAKYELTAEELVRFYEYLEKTKLRNIYTSTFLIYTEDRYYITFLNADGHEECKMKFYGNETLLFDCSYGTQPAVHKRYKIASSTLGEFFEDILR